MRHKKITQKDLYRMSVAWNAGFTTAQSAQLFKVSRAVVNKANRAHFHLDEYKKLTQKTNKEVKTVTTQKMTNEEVIYALEAVLQTLRG